MTKPTKALARQELVKTLASKPGADLRTLMKGLAALEKRATGVAEAKPPVPVVLTDEEKEAIRTLLAALANLSVPTTVRPLAPGEIAHFTTTRIQYLNVVEDLIDRAKEAVRESLFNHYDKVAETKGLPKDVQVDGKGHYVLMDCDSGAVPGLAQKLTREVSTGQVSFGSSATAADRLAALEEQGKIDHKTFLKYSRPMRVLDEQALFVAAKSGDDEAVRITQAITSQSPDYSTLQIRKNEPPNGAN